MIVKQSEEIASFTKMTSDQLTFLLVGLLIIGLALCIAHRENGPNGFDVGLCATLVAISAMIVYYTRSKEKTKGGLLQHIHQRLLELDPAAKRVFLVEGNRSFTRNKRMISLCTRRMDGTLYSMNDLMTVAIHELAHVKFDGDSSHHPDTWTTIFEDLLDKADRMGIINKNDPVEENYCGT